MKHPLFDISFINDSGFDEDYIEYCSEKYFKENKREQEKGEDKPKSDSI